MEEEENDEDEGGEVVGCFEELVEAVPVAWRLSSRCGARVS